MRRKPTARERAIARQLGISDAQLLALLSVKAGRGSDNVGHHLMDKGLVRVNGENRYELTDAGSKLLSQARSL
jgi:predicted transcriptional regulator